MEEKDGIDEPKATRGSMDKPITFTSESTSLSTTGASISKEDLILYTEYTDHRAEEDYFMEEKDGIDEPKTNRDSMDTPITFTSESTSLSTTGAIISKEDLLLCAGYLEILFEIQKTDKTKHRVSWDEKAYILRSQSFTANDSGYDSRRATQILDTSSSDAEEQKFDNEVTDTSQT